MSEAAPTHPGAFRTEHDLLGSLRVPDDAYYGIHTARARANFPISGMAVSQLDELVRSLAQVKHAAVLANAELGLIDEDRAGAIAAACVEIEAGQWHDQFCVDVMQGGAGTSTNMAANEVIANRALELLGHPRGCYEHLHPIDHVNLGQSTNDVYPTALRIAVHRLIEALRSSIATVCVALDDKAREFDALAKVGRTQLQDAVPMTLGQEFRAWSVTLGEEQGRLADAQALLCEVNLGGTAIGTSASTSTGYPPLVLAHLVAITGLPLTRAADLIEATSDAGAFVTVSSAAKRAALKLGKVCNDLRLLSSGPGAGFGELRLPPVQGGSSIMPGKVNPVVPEAVNQVAFEVAGCDLVVTLAANGGQLQLNAFGPVIATALFRALRQLSAACELLAERCLRGITADVEVLRRHAASPTGALTALVPAVGYAAVTDALVTAGHEGRHVEEILVERGLLTPTEVDARSGTGTAAPGCHSIDGHEVRA